MKAYYGIHPRLPMVADPGSFAGTAQQLAQLVLDQETTYPESHHQGAWVTDCGTKLCSAGWTVLFADGAVVQPHFGSNPWHLEDRAGELLGLATHMDRYLLFYEVTEEGARQALKMLANGEPIDWDHVELRGSWEAAQRRANSSLKYRKGYKPQNRV